MKSHWAPRSTGPFVPFLFSRSVVTMLVHHPRQVRFPSLETTGPGRARQTDKTTMCFYSRCPYGPPYHTTCLGGPEQGTLTSCPRTCMLLLFAMLFPSFSQVISFVFTSRPLSHGIPFYRRCSPLSNAFTISFSSRFSLSLKGASGRRRSTKQYGGQWHRSHGYWPWV